MASLAKKMPECVLLYWRFPGLSAIVLQRIQALSYGNGRISLASTHFRHCPWCWLQFDYKTGRDLE
jgi:hypothetical protein